jgi:hypothetical protein
MYTFGNHIITTRNYYKHMKIHADLIPEIGKICTKM